jgi:A/G-specific adenine glycosylase
MSYQQGTQASYPEKKPAKPKPQKQTLMLLHRYRDRILLYRRPPTGIWGGLWSLPEVVDSEGIAEWQTHNLASEKAPNVINTNVLKHQFTHFSLDISLALIDLEEMPGKIADEENMTFVTTAELSKYGLPTPVRKLLSSKINTQFFPLSPSGRGQG